jgi:hypothetical protein
MKIIARSKCLACGNNHELETPPEVSDEDVLNAYKEWQMGAFIQDVMPWLSAGQREILISGISPECWEQMFGKEE